MAVDKRLRQNYLRQWSVLRNMALINVIAMAMA